jgi:hypothetical protein
MDLEAEVQLCHTVANSIEAEMLVIGYTRDCESSITYNGIPVGVNYDQFESTVLVGLGVFIAHTQTRSCIIPYSDPSVMKKLRWLYSHCDLSGYDDSK